MSEKHWTNNSIVDAHWDTELNNWWTDNPPTTQGTKPVAGDSIYIHGAAPDTSPATAVAVSGLTCDLIAGYAFPSNVSFQAGAAIVVNSDTLTVASTFAGDIAVTTSLNGNFTLGAGWKVNGGSAGGNISIVVTNTISIEAPNATQVKTFDAVTLGAAAVDISGLTTFNLTGAYNLSTTTYTGCNIVMKGNSASIVGWSGNITTAVPNVNIIEI
jgi:hypothetical protein